MKIHQLLIGLSALFLCANARAVTVTQNFDSAPSDWVSNNNLTGRHFFGFTNSTHIQGAAAGELGGLISVSNTLAYYAADLGGTLNFYSNFSASGKFTAPDNPVNLFQLGYFNRADTSTPVFIGFVFADQGGGQYRVRLSLNRTPGDDRSSAFSSILLDKDYDWTLTYDPTGNGGGGTLSATITGIDTTTNLNLSLNLGGGDKANTNSLFFNSFGLVAPNIVPAAASSSFFVDNLTYTAVTAIPEPSVAAISALLLVATAAMPRRR